MILRIAIKSCNPNDCLLNPFIINLIRDTKNINVTKINPKFLILFPINSNLASNADYVKPSF